MARNTVEDVARSILAAVDARSSIGPELAAKWVSERYAEMVGRVQFRHLRRRSTIYAPTPYATGLVATTQGSNKVTGTLSGPSTSITAFNQSHVGWFFRAMNVWVRVVAVNPTTQVLTLENLYSEASSTQASFNLVQRYLPLDPNIRWISTITHPRRRKRLHERTEIFLDYRHPSRLLLGPFPYCFAEAPSARGDQPLIVPPTGDYPMSTDERKWVEVYPPSTVPEQYDVVGFNIPRDLDLDDPLPPEVSPYILREGVLVDFYRNRLNSESQKDTPSVPLIELMMNQEARQRTVWEQKIQEAVVADSIGQEVEVIVSTSNDWDYADEDICLARDQVYMQWPN